MKQEFLDFLDALMVAAPEVVKEKGTEEILEYIEALKGATPKKVGFTENGEKILKFLQTSDSSFLKAKDIGDAIGMASRTVSGSLRKLVNDGYVEKMGTAPVIYSISEKGKNYKFEGENEE
jgi:DNA-binding MarR family transcriptional regulator